MGFNKNTPRQEFTASASQTEFTFNFKIFEDTNIKAYLTPNGQDADDEVDILTLTTDYTIVINGDDGGVLTLVTPASDGDSVTILRSLEITRNTDYQSGGDFLAETIDKDQDYQTYLLADQEANTTRYLQFPTSTQNINSLLPGLTPQYYLKVNASGDGFEWAEGQSSIQNEFDTSVFRLFEGSKKISFIASSITSGTTKTITMPDANIDLGLIKEVETRLNTADEEYLGQTVGEKILKQNGGNIKSQCTAWVNFDGTTTPPTIRDSFNVSAVVRTATGIFDVYFEEGMNNENYTILPSGNNVSGLYLVNPYTDRSSSKCTIRTATIGTADTNIDSVEVHIFGGKDNV